MTTMDDSTAAARGRPHLFFGVALIMLGALLLVDRMAVMDLDVSYWPFFVIAFALIRLIDPPPSGRVPRSRRSGMWLLFIGGWGLVNEFHVYGLDYETSWPLMVVGAGLMLVWRSFEGPGACQRPQER